MRRSRCLKFSEVESKIQAYADELWFSKPTMKCTRKWLKSYHDSYNSPRYRIELRVLEGSPAKLIVVIDHCYKQAFIYDGTMRKLVRLSWRFSNVAS
jgi:hypothetical protein